MIINVIIQLIGVCAALMALLKIAPKSMNGGQRLLVGFAISMLINHFGILALYMSGNADAAVVATKMQYLGVIFVFYFTFLLTMGYFEVYMSTFVKELIFLVFVGMYISVFTTEYTDLFFVDMIKMSRNGNVDFHLQCGPMFVVFACLVVVDGTLQLIANRYKRWEFFKREKRKMPVFFALEAAIWSVFISFYLQLFFGIILPMEYTFSGLAEKIIRVLYLIYASNIGYTAASVFIFIIAFNSKFTDTVGVARKTLVDDMDEPVLVSNKEGYIVYYNKAARMVFGKIGKYKFFDDFIATNIMPHRIESPNINNSIIGNMSYSAGEIEQIEIKMEDKVYKLYNKYLFQNGKQNGRILRCIDFTDYFAYMEEVRILKENADKANDAKSAFLANMSHEIRTPINAIFGMDEMILRECRDDGIRGYAANIKSAGKILLSLINDILDLSKIESGKMEIVPVDYETRSVINDLVNMVEYRAKKKGLKFILDVDSCIPHLLNGDEIRIKQVITNVLTNAVKYTDDGEVRLKIHHQMCVNKDNSELNEKNCTIVFEVSDTGIGMHEEDIAKIFESFQRIDQKRNRHVEGTGLGMSISSKLLALMDGKLEVKSEYEKGSTFRIFVPQIIVDPSPMGEYKQFNCTIDENYVAKFTAPHASILAVDDNITNLMVIQALLKDTLVRTDLAQSGYEALRLLDSNHYDLILMDHMMPELDGLQTLKRIRERKDSNCSVIPVIALTANAAAGIKQKYIDAGFSNYLSKPVEGDKLEQMLLNYLPEELVMVVESENDNLDEENSDMESVFETPEKYRKEWEVRR